jgi:hypothetical protein
MPDFFERFIHDRNSAFIQHLAGNCASCWSHDQPIRFHLGLDDEALRPQMVARALSAGSRFTEGVLVNLASHRATFLARLHGVIRPSWPAATTGSPGSTA